MPLIKYSTVPSQNPGDVKQYDALDQTSIQLWFKADALPGISGFSYWLMHRQVTH